jgi:hypothetical protein
MDQISFLTVVCVPSPASTLPGCPSPDREHDDGNIVVAAQRDGRSIHDFQVVGEHSVVIDDVIARAAGSCLGSAL